MFQRFAYFLLFNLCYASCTTTQSPTHKDTLNTLPPSDVQIFLASASSKICKGQNPWSDKLFDSFVQNEDLNDKVWAAEKLALKTSLSGIPAPYILHLLSLGGKLKVASNPFIHCKMKPYHLSKSSDFAYCIDQSDHDFTIWLASRENNILSLKPALSEAVYAVMNAYIDIAMTNEMYDGKYYPKETGLTLFNFNKMQKLRANLLKELGLGLPLGTEEDFFNILAYMSFCSEITRQDLHVLMPEALSVVEDVLKSNFKASYQNGSQIKNLAQESLETGTQLELVNPFEDFFATDSNALARDETTYQASRNDYISRIHQSNLSDTEKAIALKRLANLDSNFTKTMEGLGAYKPDLKALQSQKEFQALYVAEFTSSHRTFLQIPKTNPKRYPISPETSNITITIPGSFEGQGTKVGGTWFDPAGPTALQYAKIMNPNEEDPWLAAFRWGGENSKQSRKEGAEDLANFLIATHEEKHASPFKISLIGHSHGGNLAYAALAHIQDLATKGHAKAHNFIEDANNDQIELNVLAIATPVRGDYVPPAWGNVVHVNMENDGVAWLGKVDGVNQIQRFEKNSTANSDKAWEEILQKPSVLMIDQKTYGKTKALAENHVRAPENFLSRLLDIKDPTNLLKSLSQISKNQE